MELEGLVMVGLVGLTIALGSYYEHKKPTEQAQQKQEVRGYGFIAYGNQIYTLKNGVIQNENNSF
jgi:hypothetical protein